MTTATATAANAIQTMLQKQVATWSVLYVKLHNYHWNVRGPEFFILHDKFKMFYTEAEVHIDKLAERLLALGGKPEATMRRYLEISSVKEATGTETVEQMIDISISDLEVIGRDLKEGIKQANQNGDETTAMMLVIINQMVERHHWMLSAFSNR